MRRHLPLRSIALAAVFAVSGTAAHDNDGKLGTVQFKVSCAPQAQREFNLAMAYYHSFAWEQIEPVLERVTKADPSCGMAHWARALTLLDNPFVWPANVPPAKLAQGLAHLESARKAGLATQRERDYVEALSAFFEDHDKINHATRARALESKMEAVARRYPDDTEASILHALVLSATFDPADKQYTNQLRAARQLEPMFIKQPDHPGVAHYLIHSYDYPPLAPQGLEAARRYAKIAPSAAHAQHMPSHIFTRVGAWEDSVVANAASAKSDTASGGNALHAYDYMVYAHLQLGQDRMAADIRDRTVNHSRKPDVFAGAYSLAAVPARVALERGDWATAAKLPLAAADTFPWAKHPQAEAINAFARGLGAAALKDAAGVQAELTRMQRLHDRLVEMKLGYWVAQVGLQMETVRGFAAFKSGQTAAGIDALKQAATREDASEKHVVSPGPLLPAREILASALLESGDAAGALREFEAVLGKEPNRLRAMAGAAVAAERSGDKAKAAAYTSRIASQTAKADAGIAGEQLARQAVLR
jgi:hypothetical protein